MSDPSFCFVLVQVELLAAKNLIGANLNGTSDPYAILNCGSEKRFRFFFLKKSSLFHFVRLLQICNEKQLFSLALLSCHVASSQQPLSSTQKRSILVVWLLKWLRFGTV